MSILSWVAVAVVFVTVWALIKRYETRLVLIAAGLFLCCISLAPMTGLNAFAKSMTNNSLIMAICGSMGFAFTASYTQCDRSLVYYLATPIRGLGIFLIKQVSEKQTYRYIDKTNSIWIVFGKTPKEA